MANVSFCSPVFSAGKRKLPQRSTVYKKTYSSSLQDAENTDPKTLNIAPRTRQRNNKSSRFNDALSALVKKRSKTGRPSYLDSSDDESEENDVKPNGSRTIASNSETESDLEEIPSFIQSEKSAKASVQTRTGPHTTGANRDANNSSPQHDQSGKGSPSLPEIKGKCRKTSGAKKFKLSFPLSSDTDDEGVDSLTISNDKKKKMHTTKNPTSTTGVRRKAQRTIARPDTYAADTSDEDYVPDDSELGRPKKRIKSCTESKRKSNGDRSRATDIDSRFVPLRNDSSSSDIDEAEFDEFLSTIRNEKHRKKSSNSTRVKQSQVSTPSSDIDEAEFFNEFLSSNKTTSSTRPKKSQVTTPSSDLDETEFFDEFLSPERRKKKKNAAKSKKSQVATCTASSSKVSSDTEMDIVENIPSNKTSNSTRPKKSQGATSTVSSAASMDIEDEINILESISTKKPKRAKVKAKDIQFPSSHSGIESNRQSSIVNFLHSTPGTSSGGPHSSSPRRPASRRSQGILYV